MKTDDSKLAEEKQMIADAKAQGLGATLSTYIKLSGPGWLQGAITLGGGSLAGSLYLGVVMGYHLMWLQPIAMILGVIMLSAISYVTLSTEERPFQMVNRHISPALGWGWLIATFMANVVWCLPQFALGTAAIKQNLIPALNNDAGTYIAAGSLLVAGTVVVWFYNSGSWGIKLFEIILKVMVGVVVISFFGVVIAMTANGGLKWGEIFAGLIPNVSSLFQPVPTLNDSIAATGGQSEWWTSYIANLQKDKIITAFATAVGINMTFLLPYSMLRKGWGNEHRGLAIFDLSIGLIVPFVLATGCVVIAAASQFHNNPDDVLKLLATGKGKEVGAYNGILDKRLASTNKEYGKLSKEEKQAAREDLPESERRLAAMLAGRDNLALAKTLQPLVGEGVSQILFGIGVLGMALSTIIILMLINGFAFCEMIGVEPKGTMHRIGCMFPAIGVLGPFIWSAAAPALATPTSVFGGAMLPIAYLSFLLLMNSKAVLGDAMPTGTSRWVWNIIMGIATAVAGFASAWGLYGKSLTVGFGESAFKFPIGNVALAALAILLLVGVISFVQKNQAAK